MECPVNIAFGNTLSVISFFFLLHHKQHSIQQNNEVIDISISVASTAKTICMDTHHQMCFFVTWVNSPFNTMKEEGSILTAH